ncbi:MAG: RNA pseudouridine synthase [Gracilibacter sp. BRH_c7a]|nr:MAG: RNA pseudouridine synthase [Gracilibacter sp. BRH_c7a]
MKEHLQDDNYEEWLKIEVPSDLRLDVALVNTTEKSRSFIQTLIAEERVLVNGQPKKANYKVQEDDIVEINYPEPKELNVEAENLDLEIVYEDDDLLVVNKPQGMVVHPAPGSWSGTMVNALLYHCRSLSSINGVIRPGIVHRIDKDTSGLIIVAKNNTAHNNLALQIKEHTAHRRYRAIVHGVLSEPSGTIDAPIGRDPRDRKKMAVVFQHSKEAITHYYVLQRFVQFTELRAVLETGRTHQIRVHMAYLKHPVLGDPLYGPKNNPFNIKGQILHAENLHFIHPTTGQEMEFHTEPPSSYQEILNNLVEINNQHRESDNE